jgi:predicted nucleic acid-binding protein
MSREVVFDASAAVKWVRAETGSGQAMGMLQAHMDGELRIWMPENCVTELLGVVARQRGPGAAERTWTTLEESGVSRVSLSAELVAECARQCESLGCSFYDALAPGLAVLVGGTLVSADSRAHRAFPGVHLIG